MNEKELEILIPSKIVWDYAMETGWTFTDFQMSSLLCHRGMPLKDEYSYLKDLGEHTADHTLREQIMEYLGEMRWIRDSGHSGKISADDIFMCRGYSFCSSFISGENRSVGLSVGKEVMMNGQGYSYADQESGGSLIGESGAYSGNIPGIGFC